MHFSWDKTYKNELANFNNHGDIGDIWFGEESIIRVIDWIKSSNLPKESSILDIGCGNGITLSYLVRFFLLVNFTNSIRDFLRLV